MQDVGGRRDVDADQTSRALARPRVRNLVNVRADGEVASESSLFGKSKALYPVKGQEKNVVPIAYTGSRSGDFKAANAAAGFTKTPKGYIWHHLHDYDPKTNMGTMQLVRGDVHGVNVPHYGGVDQYVKHHGTKYKR